MVTDSVAALPEVKNKKPAVEVALPFNIIEPLAPVVKVVLALPDTLPVADTVMSELAPPVAVSVEAVVDTAPLNVMSPLAPELNDSGAPAPVVDTVLPAMVVMLP